MFFLLLSILKQRYKKECNFPHVYKFTIVFEMNNDSLLKIENLSLGFTSDEGFSIAIENVSLELCNGQIMGIVGESGSGKTVTSMAVMRLLSSKTCKIISGKIWFNASGEQQVNLLDQSENYMQSIRGKNIGMIFQDPMSSLNPVMKCGKQVAESMIWHGILKQKEAKSRVLQLFEEVKLPNPQRIYDSYPHELSGGQRQRVVIAMAISCRPKLLIADEPTTALDVTVQKSILELIKELQKKYNMSILFITHDLGVVADIAEVVTVMYKGKVVETGTLPGLFINPTHPYTKGLILCRPSLSERPTRLPVINDFLIDDEEKAKNENVSFSAPKESIKLSRKENHAKIYSKPPILTVENLKTGFVVARSFLGKPLKYFNAVDDISFELYEGETLGLVGESGCGKTTLGRTIMRLIEPRAGNIIYKGIDLSKLSTSRLRKLRPKIQIIFQDPYSSLTPGMLVGEAIMEPMKVHGILSSKNERKNKTIDLLEKVGLNEKHFYRYPHEFSGGQRQRICIARALALNPDFIVCDESVSSLDVSVQAQVLNLLNQLKEDYNLTYVFISHDLSVVKYMSDRIMVMKDGKLVELSDADALYKNPKEEYTRNLINAIPNM
jgi:peptide/nickel transport system ATP-binding protein